MEELMQLEPSNRLAQLLRFLDMDPNNRNLLSDAIKQAFDEGHSQTLDNLVTNGLNKFPEDNEFLSHAGLYALFKNECSAAKEYFQKIVNSGVEDSTIFYNLAYAHLQNHEYEAALKIADKISEKEWQQSSAILKARCLHNIDRLDEAIELLTPFICDDHTDIETQGLAALLHQDNGNFKKAQSLAKSCFDSAKPSMESLIALGESSMHLNDFNLSEEAFISATQNYPQAGRAWSGLGQLQFKSFDLQNAEDSLLKAVEFMPNHIDTWQALAWVYLMKDDINAAESAFQKAYALDRSFGETHGGLASIFALRGELDKANHHIRIAESLNPISFSASYARMIVLNKQGNTDEALMLFEKIKETTPPLLDGKTNDNIEKHLRALVKNYK